MGSRYLPRGVHVTTSRLPRKQRQLAPALRSWTPGKHAKARHVFGSSEHTVQPKDNKQ